MHPNSGAERLLLETILYGTANTLNSYLASPLTWIFFALGSMIGSFLNVCILRIPEGEFWKTSRSVCPSCKQPIPFYLNIPILGFFFLLGKARCCGAKLSWQYPVVEALTGAFFALLYWKYPFIFGGGLSMSIDAPELIRYIHASLLISVLIVCSVIDIRLQIIPDVISLPMIVATPLIVYFHPELTWQSSLIGVVAGGGSLFSIAWIYWMLRHQVGMGMGDVKLLAGIGGWLGFQAVLPSIFYGSVLGSVVGLLGLLITRDMNMSSKIPFGPFLAVGAILHLLVGTQIQEIFFSGP